jgi:hypothetical protein
MSRPIVTSVTIIAGVANGITTSQTLGSAGPLTLNGSLVSGGKVVLDAPRRIIITSAGNDSGITWTITGTSRPQTNGGGPLVETIQGADAGIAPTTQDFATVTSIDSSGATASTVTAGTDETASGPWVPFSEFQTNFQATLFGHILSGTPVWQVDITYDDVFGTWLPPGQPFPIAIALSDTVGSTADGDAGITMPVRAARLTLTEHGGVQLTTTQQGI